MDVKVGIVLDDWKLRTFERCLRKAGFKWEKQDGPGKGLVLLRVVTSEVEKLQQTIEKAVEECGS